MLVVLGDGIVNTDEIVSAQVRDAKTILVLFKDGSTVQLESKDPKRELSECAANVASHA